ncbi:MAG: hypothetical protein WA741_22855, partial [Candidatus Sulfotelmatobacter sp.]
MRSISKRIAYLCVLLTFWSALAFALHHHSSATEGATCTVCVAAHSASPEVPFALAHTTSVVVPTFLPQTLSAK